GTKVLDRGPDVVQHSDHSRLQRVEVFLRLCSDAQVHHRLDVYAGCRAWLGRAHIDQLSLIVAPNGEDGVHDELNVDVLARQLGRHGVDQERHIVVDDLDDGVRGVPAVFVEAWTVDAELELAGAAHEGKVVEGNACRI